MADNRQTRRKRTPLAIGAVTEGLFSVAQPSRYPPITQLRLAWSGICGAALSAHTHPLEIRGRSILISATAPTWANALLDLETSILDHCKRYAPQVNVIQTVVQAGATEAPPVATEPTATSDATADFTNDALRRSVDGLLEAVRAQNDTSKGSK